MTLTTGPYSMYDAINKYRNYLISLMTEITKCWEKQTITFDVFLFCCHKIKEYYEKPLKEKLKRYI